MQIRFKTILSLLFLCLQLNTHNIFASADQEKIIDDYNYKFSITLSDGWYIQKLEESPDKIGITYTIWNKDSTYKMTIQLMAFKLGAVKNLDDFIYNMEKNIELNIPSKSGDYNEKDFGKYDMKSAVYKDNVYYEQIYYFRTKIPEATNNYVYMVRFITNAIEANSDTEAKIQAMIDTFKSTAE